MKSFTSKRIMAYLIDLLIVIFISGLLSQIKVLNPYGEKYKATYDEYQEYYKGILDSDGPYDVYNDKKLINYMHTLSKCSLSYTIIETTVIILYFTLFPYYNNGQTVGKRITHIKVVHKDNRKKVSIFQYLLRSLIIPIWGNVLLYNPLEQLIMIFVILFLKGKAYLIVCLILQYGISIYSYAELIYSAFRKDHKTFHDRFARTEVIEC